VSKLSLGILMQAASKPKFNVILTGGIGSGKTAVSDVFSALNVEIIDTDIISRQVVEPNSLGLSSLVNYFGEDILNPDQSLNRSALRALVFSNNNARTTLNQILHPLIEQEVSRQLELVNSSYSITVVPLFDKNSSTYEYDRVLVIEAPESLQIERASKRDNCSPEHISQIMDTQLTNAQRRQQADDMIINDANLADLTEQVYTLHDKYLQMSLLKGLNNV
jgi:dephospho-CoA kinase